MNINTFVHVQGSEIIQIACFTRACGKCFTYTFDLYSLMMFCVFQNAVKVLQASQKIMF